jgi:hypothetical protein
MVLMDVIRKPVRPAEVAQMHWELVSDAAPRSSSL